MYRSLTSAYSWSKRFSVHVQRFACIQRYERQKGDSKILFFREWSYEIIKCVIVLTVGERLPDNIE